MFRSKYFIASAIAILLFIIYKIPDLSLPYYWDEAYPYSYAIQHLLKNGVSMMPNSIPEDYSTGHPLLFYFLEACWMKIFGNNIVAAKSFPLTLSVILLCCIFFFCKKFFHEKTGFISIIAICFQSIFIVQSSMVLPEVLLTLLTLLTLWTYLSANSAMYIVWGSLLLLTKESGFVCITSILAVEIIRSLKNRSINFSNLLLLCIPFISGAAFYLIQKNQMGWFFYPRHMGYISFDLQKILDRLIDGYAAMLFISYGRFFISMLLLIFFGIFFIKKTAFSSIEKTTCLTVGLFILFYLLFSAINFYSPRYIVCCIIFLMILFSFILLKLFKKKQWIAYVLSATLLIIFSYYNFLIKSDCDTDLGYYDSIEVQKEAVRFCEEKDWKNKNIYTLFLMYHQLTTPHLGYLGSYEKTFSNVNCGISDNTEICIIPSTEQSLAPPAFENKFTLIKTVKKGNSWIKIYKKK